MPPRVETCRPRRFARTVPVTDAPRWYENAIIYAIDVGTFHDGNGDGVGDFRGVTDKLDYLSWLGVDALWLMPFYASPHRDNGYDVSDHLSVDDRHGSLSDFVVFMREAERRGLRVLPDLVLNHTSDEHPWFAAARQSRLAPERAYYVWTDDPAKEEPRDEVFPGRQCGTWTWEPQVGAWYLHHFYPFQPDLDTGNPAVQREMRAILEFWLRLGASGFRIDAAPYLCTCNGTATDENAPEILATMRGWAARHNPEAILMAEADLPADELGAYFGEPGQRQLLFDFLRNQHLFLALSREDAEPLRKLELPEPPDGGRWLTFLRHHDELTLARLDEEEREDVFAAFAPDEDMRIFDRGLRRRLAPMFGGPGPRLDLVLSLLFSLPGTPMLYYGDDIGMGEDLSLPERYPVRTPMQWSPEGPHGGFSDVPPDTLEWPVISGGAWGFERVNVATEREDPDSHLCRVRRLIAARKACPVIGRSDWEPLDAGDPAVFAHRASADGEAMLFLHNLSPSPRTAELAGVDLSDAEPVWASGDDPLALEPYGYRWLRLRGEANPG